MTKGINSVFFAISPVTVDSNNKKYQNFTASLKTVKNDAGGSKKLGNGSRKRINSNAGYSRSITGASKNKGNLRVEHEAPENCNDDDAAITNGRGCLSIPPDRESGAILAADDFRDHFQQQSFDSLFRSAGQKSAQLKKLCDAVPEGYVRERALPQIAAAYHLALLAQPSGADKVELDNIMSKLINMMLKDQLGTRSCFDIKQKGYHAEYGAASKQQQKLMDISDKLVKEKNCAGQGDFLLETQLKPFLVRFIEQSVGKKLSVETAENIMSFVDMKTLQAVDNVRAGTSRNREDDIEKNYRNIETLFSMPHYLRELSSFVHSVHSEDEEHDPTGKVTRFGQRREEAIETGRATRLEQRRELAIETGRATRLEQRREVAIETGRATNLDSVVTDGINPPAKRWPTVEIAERIIMSNEGLRRANHILPPAEQTRNLGPFLARLARMRSGDPTSSVSITRDRRMHAQRLDHVATGGINPPAKRWPTVEIPKRIIMSNEGLRRANHALPPAEQTRDLGPFLARLAKIRTANPVSSASLIRDRRMHAQRLDHVATDGVTTPAKRWPTVEIAKRTIMSNEGLRRANHAQPPAERTRDLGPFLARLAKIRTAEPASSASLIRDRRMHAQRLDHVATAGITPPAKRWPTVEIPKRTIMSNEGLRRANHAQPPAEHTRDLGPFLARLAKIRTADPASSAAITRDPRIHAQRPDHVATDGITPPAKRWPTVEIPKRTIMSNEGLRRANHAQPPAEHTRDLGPFLARLAKIRTADPASSASITRDRRMLAQLRDMRDTFGQSLPSNAQPEPLVEAARATRFDQRQELALETARAARYDTLLQMPVETHSAAVKDEESAEVVQHGVTGKTSPPAKRWKQVDTSYPILSDHGATGNNHHDNRVATTRAAHTIGPEDNQ